MGGACPFRTPRDGIARECGRCRHVHTLGKGEMRRYCCFLCWPPPTFLHYYGSWYFTCFFVCFPSPTIVPLSHSRLRLSVAFFLGAFVAFCFLWGKGVGQGGKGYVEGDALFCFVRNSTVLLTGQFVGCSAAPRVKGRRGSKLNIRGRRRGERARKWRGGGAKSRWNGEG